MTVRLLLLATCFVAAMCFAPASAADDPGADAPTIVLDNTTIWRMHHTLRPPMIEQPGGKTEPLMVNIVWLDWETSPPPEGWTSPEADDRGWTRGPARRFARTPYLSRLSMRGKFEVTDPEAVGDLSLAVEYFGGAVVYVNGTEVGRKNLPEGADPAEALADPYPDEAYVNDEGKVYGDRRVDGPPKDIVTRRLDLTVPKTLLREGVNVLAIDVVRAAYPAMLLEKEHYGVGGTSKDPALKWSTCELRTVELSADSPDGIVPNRTRPEGVQVWNADTLAADVDVDYGDRTEPLRPIAMSAPRNGSVFGKVLVGRDQPIQDLRVTASELASGDSAPIPASSVSFFYGVPGGRQEMPASGGARTYPHGTTVLHALRSKPLDEFPVYKRGSNESYVHGAVVPLWMRVKVPEDSAPGVYRGNVTVNMADASPVEVPVELTVLTWTMPDRQEFRTWAGLIQSPDTLAVEYDVPLWSDEHFDLIGRSFDLVSETGCRIVYVPAIAHTNLGNAESMIRWKKKSDGSYDWDFSVMDRYLDTVEEHLGTPRLVVLQVWEVYMNTRESTGRRFGQILDKNQQNTGGAPLVTFVDADGATTNDTIAKLSDPASKPVWKELMTRVRARLKERGLEDKLLLGMFTDSAPNKQQTQFFLDVAPGLEWVQQGHNAFKDLHGMAEVGYTAVWWSGRFADDLVNRRSEAVRWQDGFEGVMTSMHGWNRPEHDVYFPRMNNQYHPASYWRFLCETAITSDFYEGIGRVGIDFWPAIKDRRGRRRSWVNDRFVETAGYLHEIRSYILNPLDDGPGATNRLVALEEGIQECEARIVIEDALINKDLAEIDPALAKRCRQALEQRLMYMWKGLDQMQFGGWGVGAWRYQAGVSGHAWLLHTDPHQRTRKLYELAAEVENALSR